MTPKLVRPATLRADHVLDDFACGEPALDEWLKKKAFASALSRTANTFVICRGKSVVGFYALATASIAHAEANAKLRRNSPDPVPAILLARVAISMEEKGRGLGRALVSDAMRRTLVASRHVAARTLLVHALNAGAVAFYTRLGFTELPNPSNVEVVPMHMSLDTITTALKKAAELRKDGK